MTNQWIVLDDAVAFCERWDGPCADLVIADPSYHGVASAAWDNQWSTRKEYLEWCARWMAAIRPIVSETGSVFVFCRQECAAEFDLLLSSLYKVRDRIIWHYPTGLGRRLNLTQLWQPLFWCTVGDRYKFNLDAVRVPYRLYARSKQGQDPRNNPEGQNPGDVWEFDRVHPGDYGNTGYETQKPIALADRIVLMSSDPDDLVYVPFVGSGTEMEAARRNGRRFIGTDTNPEAVRVASQR